MPGSATQYCTVCDRGHEGFKLVEIWTTVCKQTLDVGKALPYALERLAWHPRTNRSVGTRSFCRSIEGYIACTFLSLGGTGTEVHTALDIIRRSETCTLCENRMQMWTS